MSEHFEVSFDRTREGKHSVRLSVAPKDADPLTPSRRASVSFQNPRRPPWALLRPLQTDEEATKFTLNGSQLKASVHRLAEAADTADRDLEVDLQQELQYQQQRSRYLSEQEKTTGHISDEDDQRLSEPIFIPSRAYPSPLRLPIPKFTFSRHQESSPTPSPSPTQNTLAARRQRKKCSAASLQSNTDSPSKQTFPKNRPLFSLLSSDTPAPLPSPGLGRARQSVTASSPDINSQFHLRGKTFSMNNSQGSCSSQPTGVGQTFPRQYKEDDLFFAIGSEGDIIIPDEPQATPVSQASSQRHVHQPSTPSEGIIIPRVRKSHVNPENRIIVEVGGREFLVCTDILEESLWFRKAIRRCSSAATRDSPRRIVIENDPDIFADVLKYLRTGMCPLYWDKMKGFDYGRYAELACQASTYLIHDLWTWITEQKYLHAVTITAQRSETKVRKGAPHHQRHVQQGDWELRVDAVLEGVDEIWICPKGFPDHEGDSTMCELQRCCKSGSAKDYPEQRYIVDVTRIFTTETTYSVDFDALRPKK